MGHVRGGGKATRSDPTGGLEIGDSIATSVVHDGSLCVWILKGSDAGVETELVDVPNVPAAARGRGKSIARASSEPSGPPGCRQVHNPKGGSYDSVLIDLIGDT